MILKFLLIVATTLCFLLFTFGIYRLTKEIEPNLCQMTYMFKNPKYTKIPQKNFVGYGLYYYNEGNEPRAADLSTLNGAPVLFVPGNGGSYKQVRSLGSVALRIGLGYNKPHLDYFTIDYNEELSALYGGYLTRQQRYLKYCINKILRLYRGVGGIKRKIVIIAHSMGGIVAKSMLTEDDWLRKIAVIIFIATPLAHPVIYADKEIDNFYQQTNELLLAENEGLDDDDDTSIGFRQNATNIANVLLISIGGGSRDILVPSTLTESSLSDVHTITTALPHVWLTCDHLAAMWCLQLMKVINKFLYELTYKTAEGYTLFGTNAVLNLETARHYFMGEHNDLMYDEAEDALEFPMQNTTATTTLSFYKIFENGLRVDYQQAIFYEDVAPYEHIYIAVTHETKEEQWLFGCQHDNCVENQILTQQIMRLPTTKHGHKSYAVLNLAAIFSTFGSWTHLLIRLGATSHYASLYIDVHNADERTIVFQAPQWFEFKPRALNLTTEEENETKAKMFRRLQINGLSTTFYAFKLKFETVTQRSHDKLNYETTIRIYAPFAVGFDRYYTLTPAQIISNDEVLIQLPKRDFNASKTLLYVDVHTDPWCDLSLSYHFSLSDTMRNLVQQHIMSFICHMAVIIIACLGTQFQKTQFKTRSYLDFLQLKSWYFIFAVRLAPTAVALMPYIPQELLQHTTKSTTVSCYASLIVHGFAIVCCIVIAQFLRLNVHILSVMAKKMSIPATYMPKLHIIFAVMSTTLVCSKSISLLFILFIYTIIIAIAANVNSSQNPSQKINNDDDDDVYQELKESEDESSSNESSVSHAKASKNVGFQDLNFHIALMTLIVLLILINFGDTIALYKGVFENNSYYSLQTFSTLVFTPVILVICCLPLLWHLHAPFNTQSTPIFALILNAIAAMSLLLCEDKLYRLNYMSAFVVALFVLRELLLKRKY